MRLNVGCGDYRAPAPWVNLDSFEGVRPDVVADARDLPFADSSVERLYCGHVLEHLSRDEGVPRAIREFRRVLRRGGLLAAVGPCYDLARLDDGSGVVGDQVLLSLIRTGGGRWAGDVHLWTATGAETLEAIRREFPAAELIDQALLADDWPVAARVPWQFAITATKERDDAPEA